MTVKEASTVTGLSKSSIYAMVEAGTFSALRIGPKGGKIVLDDTEIYTYMLGKKPQSSNPLKSVGGRCR